MIANKVRQKGLLMLGTAVIMVSCFFLLCARVQAKKGEDSGAVEGRVLFISSYSYAWDTVRMQIDGIMGNLGPAVVLDFEYMDTKRVSDDTAMQLFYEGLKYRLSQVEPYDVVILGDDAALLFALEHRDELFSGIPLVFEGINDETLAREVVKDPLITGVLEKLFVDKNIEFGLRLNPQAVRVVAILDDSITGEAERINFYSYQNQFPDMQFLEINSSQLASDQLKKSLQQVSKYSILIYFSMTEDADGKHYSYSEALQLIRENASVPTLRMVEAGIGEGILGGNVVSMTMSGEIAAQMAMDILEGRDPAEIEMVESPNIYCVDQDIMKKYNLNMSDLPEETIVINGGISFFTRNKEALVPAILLVVGLLAVMGVIALDNFRGRQLRKELEEAKNIMESASQHDFLTGLPNRSKFMEDLENLIAAKKPCTVIMLDIDDFKKINDTMGHTAGDDALKQVAARLKELTSPILTAYRFAGDEFIMIQQSSQRKIVEKTAYQCRQLFSRLFLLNGEKYRICGSIGLASYPNDTDNLEQLIICADEAMYQVKKSGKNDFAFYQKSGEANSEA